MNHRRSLGLNILLLMALLLPGERKSTLAALLETVDALIPLPEIERKTPVSADVVAREGDLLRSAPVMFIENVGQFTEDARFQVRGSNGILWLADDAIWITVFEKESEEVEVKKNVGADAIRLRTSTSALRTGVNIKLSFPGANPQSRLEPFNRLETKVSYFIGNDSKQWHPDVAVWGGVRYVDLHPGIDLEVTSEEGEMVLRLHTRPGADIRHVALRAEGIEALTLDGDRLHLSTTAGEVSLPLLTMPDLPGVTFE